MRERGMADTTDNPTNPPGWLTIAEFSERHPGISRWLVGEMVRRGELLHVRAGRRVLIREDALLQLAERQAAERAGVDFHHVG